MEDTELREASPAPEPSSEEPRPDSEQKSWLRRRMETPRRKVAAAALAVSLAVSGSALLNRGGSENDASPKGSQDPDIALSTGQSAEPGSAVSTPTSAETGGFGRPAFPDTQVISPVPVTTEAPVSAEQKKIDDILLKAGYYEKHGNMPTFHHEVETGDANINVLSFLSTEVLPEGSFDKVAYDENVEYMEEVAHEKRSFTWNPQREGGEVVSRQYVPRKEGDKKLNSFVVLFSGNDPLPQRLLRETFQSDVLKTAIDNKTTFFYTVVNADGGTTSFVRYVEPDTYKYAVPTDPPNQIATPLDQINAGLALEAFIMSGKVDPFDSNAYESLKQSVAQAFVLAQQNRPFVPMAEQRLGRPISEKSKRVYYPTGDGQIKQIYDHAPRKRSVKSRN